MSDILNSSDLQEKDLYIDPQRLRSLIRDFKEDLKKNPDAKMSDELGLCLIKLAKGFASRSCFSSYSYRTDFEMCAVEKMIKAVEKIDPDDPRSPFAYLTQTCYRSIINYIKKEKKYAKVKDHVADYVYNEFAQVYGIKQQFNPNNQQEEETSEKPSSEVDGEI